MFGVVNTKGDAIKRSQMLVLSNTCKQHLGKVDADSSQRGNSSSGSLLYLMKGAIELIHLQGDKQGRQTNQQAQARQIAECESICVTDVTSVMSHHGCVDRQRADLCMPPFFSLLPVCTPTASSPSRLGLQQSSASSKAARQTAAPPRQVQSQDPPPLGQTSARLPQSMDSLPHQGQAASPWVAKWRLRGRKRGCEIVFWDPALRCNRLGCLDRLSQVMSADGIILL